MIYLFGAIALVFISVRAVNQSHKIYVEQKGWWSKTRSILLMLIGLGAVLAAHRAVIEFKNAMGW